MIQIESLNELKATYQDLFSTLINTNELNTYSRQENHTSPIYEHKNNNMDEEVYSVSYSEENDWIETTYEQKPKSKLSESKIINNIYATLYSLSEVETCSAKEEDLIKLKNNELHGEELRGKGFKWKDLSDSQRKDVRETLEKLSGCDYSEKQLIQCFEQNRILVTF